VADFKTMLDGITKKAKVIKALTQFCENNRESAAVLSEEIIARMKAASTTDSRITLFYLMDSISKTDAKPVYLRYFLGTIVGVFAAACAAADEKEMAPLRMVLQTWNENRLFDKDIMEKMSVSLISADGVSRQRQQQQQQQQDRPSQQQQPQQHKQQVDASQEKAHKADGGGEKRSKKDKENEDDEVADDDVKAPKKKQKKEIPTKEKSKATNRKSAASENTYTVEIILDDKVEGGKKYYYIKWLGYSHAENTWEPETNILDRTLINAYKSLKK